MNLKTYIKFYNYRRKVAGSSKDRLPMDPQSVIVATLFFILCFIVGSICIVDAFKNIASDPAGESANRIAGYERAECVCEKCGGVEE